MENEKNNSEQEAGEMMHASNANTFTVGCGMMYADRTEVLEFGANRYKKLQMVLQGYYTVQIIDMPSQHFAVKINGKPIYGKDLVGKEIVE